MIPIGPTQYYPIYNLAYPPNGVSGDNLYALCCLSISIAVDQPGCLNVSQTLDSEDLGATKVNLLLRYYY